MRSVHAPKEKSAKTQRSAPLPTLDLTPFPNGATTQSILVNTSGNYTVTVIGASGFTATSVATAVTVNPNRATPVVTASGPTTFCAGGSVTLTAPPSSSYRWCNGAATHSISVNTSGSYSVTITNASGYAATSAATAVNVYANPATPVISASGPTSFCASGSVTLTAPAATSYSWSNGATTQSITVNASGSYSVVVTNANGCSAASAATSVVVNQPPATPVVTASGPTTFCAGGSVTLTAPAASYLWSTGATTQSITPTTAGSYSVIVTDANGCQATSSATSVTVNPLPTITFTAPGWRVCGTVEADEEVQALTGTSVTYAWTISGGVITQNAGHRIYFTANPGATQVVPGVTITDGNGCSSSGSDTRPVVALPDATITPSGPTTFCAGGSVTISAPASASYSWSNGATTQAISVSTSGSYSVTVTNASGCSVTSAATTVNAAPATLVVTPPGLRRFAPAARSL